MYFDATVQHILRTVNLPTRPPHERAERTQICQPSVKTLSALVDASIVSKEQAIVGTNILFLCSNTNTIANTTATQSPLRSRVNKQAQTKQKIFLTQSRIPGRLVNLTMLPASTLAAAALRAYRELASVLTAAAGTGGFALVSIMRHFS